MPYIYRSDSVRSLLKIQKYGISFRPAKDHINVSVANLLKEDGRPNFRTDIPLDTAWAEHDGGCIPDQDDMLNGRIYYIASETKLWNLNTLKPDRKAKLININENTRLGVRFPKPCNYNDYPDGQLKGGARYIIDSRTPSCIVMKAINIEVYLDNSWQTLSKIEFQY